MPGKRRIPLFLWKQLPSLGLQYQFKIRKTRRQKRRMPELVRHVRHERQSVGMDGDPRQCAQPLPCRRRSLGHAKRKPLFQHQIQLLPAEPVQLCRLPLLCRRQIKRLFFKLDMQMLVRRVLFFPKDVEAFA